MTAIWNIDYDTHTDSNYQRPCCPKCMEPIIYCEDEGVYRCVNCQNTVEVTEPDMIQWFKDRSDIKQEIEICHFGCKQKTLLCTYRKNPVTLKWEAAFGICKNCGLKFIV